MKGIWNKKLKRADRRPLFVWTQMIDMIECKYEENRKIKE